MPGKGERKRDRRFFQVGRRRSDWVRLAVEAILLYKLATSDSIDPAELLTLLGVL